MIRASLPKLSPAGYNVVDSRRSAETRPFGADCQGRLVEGLTGQKAPTYRVQVRQVPTDRVPAGQGSHLAGGRHAMHR
jgi:hypothetical protein